MVNIDVSVSAGFGGAPPAGFGGAPPLSAPAAAARPSPPAAAGGGGGGGGGPAPLDDVFTAYRFWVELESGLVAGFTECSGIQAEAEVQDWLEGGENTTVRRFPGRARYGNITLKHGFTDSTKLWDWFAKVLKGQPNRKPMSIILMDPQGKRKRTWNFDRCFPVKWQGPALKTSGNEMAIETVEFAHEGLLGL